MNSFVNWERVSFCYTPSQSGEQFLIIGSSTALQTGGYSTGNPGSCTVTANVNYSTVAYVYIDEVSVLAVNDMLNVTSQTICPATPVQVNALNCVIPFFPYTMSWNPTTGLSNPGIVTPSITINSNQTYTNTLSITTSANQTCSATAQLSVSVYPDAGPLNVSATQTIICPGSASTLSVTGGAGSYTWSPGALTGSSIVVTPTATTVYTVISTTSIGCTRQATIQITVPVSPSFTFAATASPEVICSNLGQSTTLTATSNGSPTYTWNPGNLVGTPQVLTPTVTTVYTLSATISGCVLTKTITVTVSGACCSSTAIAFTSSTFPESPTGLTYTIPIVFNSDVTIPSGQTVTFSDAEYLFAPNVKVIVSPGARLTLRGAHLYACTDMWTGIVVQDGGTMLTTVSGGTVQGHNLIEDAINAIDVTNNTSTLTATNPVLDIRYTTFNKNFIGIKIDSYQENNSSYPFVIRECVFTSRSLTFTPTSWPKTTTTDLRSATNATTGLAVPYLLQTAALAVLKNPNAAQSASVGIALNNVGITAGGVYYNIEIGENINAGSFNLFDGLWYGIHATNSNISSINNVFQNSQYKKLCKFCPLQGGVGIKSNITIANLNAALNMASTGTNSTNLSLGNRFWDCHTAVEATNVYKLDCNYATFRSATQSTANTAYGPGNKGISASTNRILYNIKNCNFSNINTGINIPISAGTYSYGSNTYTGVISSNFQITNNYFGAQLTNTTSITNQYMYKAINISAPTTATWTLIGGGLAISTNSVDRAYNGAHVNGFMVANTISSNTITLKDDNVFNATQNGIRVENTTGGIVQTNTLTGATTTNTLMSLVFSSLNSGHSVLCNNTYTANTGFQFDGSHGGTTTWKGNKMQTHAKGFVLSTSGVIGIQGGVGAPSDNQWSILSTWTGTNNAMTFMDNSNASGSKLYTQTGAPWQTTNNFGNNATGNWYSAPTNTVGTTGAYSCGGGGGGGGRMAFNDQPVKNTWNSNNDGNRITNAVTNSEYIAMTGNYRYLIGNDSIRNSDSTYITFCNILTGTSIDKFMQAEISFYNGDAATAQVLSSAITTTNDVEANYKEYYTLYNEYASHSFGSSDSTALYAFAQKCPGIDGACVYQARALYNTIYGNSHTFTDNCAITSNERKLMTGNLHNSQSSGWYVKLHPNPASNQINIISSLKSENLKVVIKDVTGKIVLSQNLTSVDFIANLDVNLINGVYLITLYNNKNERVTKKLVIAN